MTTRWFAEHLAFAVLMGTLWYFAINAFPGDEMSVAGAAMFGLLVSFGEGLYRLFRERRR